MFVIKLCDYVSTAQIQFVTFPSLLGRNTPTPAHMDHVNILCLIKAIATFCMDLDFEGYIVLQI